MRATVALYLAAQIAIASASAISAEEECGDLGVMPVPPGEDPSQYRKCFEHPNGHDINFIVKDGDDTSADAENVVLTEELRARLERLDVWGDRN